MSGPFTPRHTPRPSSQLGLTNKQYSKITGTIATVRRQAKSSAEAAEEEDEVATLNGRTRREQPRVVPNREAERKKARVVGGPGKPPTKTSEETSFAIEASFVKAPLNTRVVSQARVASSSGTHHRSKGKEKEYDPSSLQGIPLEVQEALILEDLLSVLMGIPGTYITLHPSYDPEATQGGLPFIVHPTLDRSLRDLVERLLPLATYYTAISAFVEIRADAVCGLVNHALGAAIRDMLNKDYLTLISQLEHLFNTSPGFSLQKLWFYLHPTLHTLSLVNSLTEELMEGDFANALGDDDDEDDEEIDEIDAIDEELGLAFGKKNKLKALDAMNDAGIVKGGEVVAILWERVMNMSGDPAAHELYLSLFRRASAPYAQMLHRWITLGHLKDPWDEFMVKESRDINRQIIEMDYIDDYWERRYTLRDGSAVSGSDRRPAGIPKPRMEGGRLPGGACIPPLLDGWKQKILLAGKYINVIQECGIKVPQGGLKKKGDAAAKQADAELALDDERFYIAIEEAYTFANRTLLQLLVKDQDLIPRLRSLKYYFFLSHSAYIGGFFETAREELKKAAKFASTNRLQSLYDLALASSPGPEEGGGFRGDVKLVMAATSLWDFLTHILNIEGAIVGDDLVGRDDNQTGDERKVHRSSKEKGKEKENKDTGVMQAMDAMSLDYNVKFPISLIISRKSILYYQLIFRFLLHLKHTEQVILDMWAEHKNPPWSLRTPHADLERWKLRVVLLRMKMLSYVQHVLAFVTGDILEPSWRGLEAKLEKAAQETTQGTVDQLLRDHSDFLNTCMKGCLLTTSKFLKLYHNMLHTCTRFAAYNSKMTRALEQAMDALANGDCDLKASPMNKRWEMLHKFEMNFGHHQKAFYDQVQYNAMSEVALLPLVHRLNQGRLSS